jgi:hypothetical protein
MYQNVCISVYLCLYITHMAKELVSLAILPHLLSTQEVDIYCYTYAYIYVYIHVFKYS